MVGRFSKTLMVALVAAGVSWRYRDELFAFWSAPYLLQFQQTPVELGIMSDSAVFVATTQAVSVTAALLAFPVFCAEAWLLICDKAARPAARALTLPFALSSTGVAVFGVWLVRHIEMTVHIGPGF